MNNFAGDDYIPQRDDSRLLSQLETIRDYMLGHGGFCTLQEIADVTGYPHASVSAQLRHLTRQKHGGYIKNRIYCGDGLYAYQIVRPEPPTQMDLPMSVTDNTLEHPGSGRGSSHAGDERGAPAKRKRRKS